MRLRCPLQPEALETQRFLRSAFLLWLLSLSLLISGSNAISSSHLSSLRQDTQHLFYHGFDNYMNHAFPEDELRPISCKPLTRDVGNPGHIELNDPLGNYSLTLVDSLSTLAILASATGPQRNRRKALSRFQEGVAALVEHYGDGTNGSTGLGSRARGFDLDSKVQVFETVIRGVGGLLSAHLFATGELPITGYSPNELTFKDRDGREGIRWSPKFIYSGQLLDLAHDLGKRLLPAFSTSTGIPYPRVNLRHGIPFYMNSPLNCNKQDGKHGTGSQAQCSAIPPTARELTETCSAGAGSLVLEFTVLSRLTGDVRFENAAKRAFWSIWERRSNIGLVGSGIDAETGLWTSPYTGLGAGIDSFFEYAVKSYILLSGSSVPLPTNTTNSHLADFDPPLLSAWQHASEGFLGVWEEAHTAIKRHLYRGESYVHPHYVQADLNTGATRAFWVDSLSAFFPGLLTLTGDLNDAIETHLLFTALWTRYSAIPERWSTTTASVEGGLGWWGGRPEFIESTYYIYRATKDPWYLHVGEMVLRDIERRCWTTCGWSGLQDVRTGERSDRMESFFLGETAKYLHLLFDPDHPLNKLDAPFVFTTEGHPLIIPKSKRSMVQRKAHAGQQEISSTKPAPLCPLPPVIVPLTISHTAARKDIFHAANLARLHLMPSIEQVDSPLIEIAHDHPSITASDVRSPSNYTFFPWTLPVELIPRNGCCSAIQLKSMFDITFPASPAMLLNTGLLQRVGSGVLISGMQGVRLSMVRDVPATGTGTGTRSGDSDLFRVFSINNVPLGKDEKVFLTRDTMASVVSETDPNFTRVRNPTILDIVFDVEVPEPTPALAQALLNATPSPDIGRISRLAVAETLGQALDKGSHLSNAFRFVAQQVSSMITEPSPKVDARHHRHYIPAITPTGPGFAPVPDVLEAPPQDAAGNAQGGLLWHKIYVGDQNCHGRLPAHVPRENHIVVLKRGGCSFSQKLENVPSFAPSSASLQLVIVVSFTDDDDDDVDDEGLLIRPYLDIPQLTPGGLARRNPIPLVMVAGGQVVYDALGQAVELGVKRRYTVQAQGIPISNVFVL